MSTDMLGIWHKDIRKGGESYISNSNFDSVQYLRYMKAKKALFLIFNKSPKEIVVYCEWSIASFESTMYVSWHSFDMYESFPAPKRQTHVRRREAFRKEQKRTNDKLSIMNLSQLLEMAEQKPTGRCYHQNEILFFLTSCA